MRRATARRQPCQRRRTGQATIEYLFAAMAVVVEVLAVVVRVWMKSIAMTAAELGSVNNIPAP